MSKIDFAIDIKRGQVHEEVKFNLWLPHEWRRPACRRGIVHLPNLDIRFPDPIIDFLTGNYLNLPVVTKTSDFPQNANLFIFLSACLQLLTSIQRLFPNN